MSRSVVNYCDDSAFKTNPLISLTTTHLSVVSRHSKITLNDTLRTDSRTLLGFMEFTISLMSPSTPSLFSEFGNASSKADRLVGTAMLN